MTVTVFDTTALDTIQSSEQQNLLDEIDNLRLQGISEFVFLPQIVVCGDQSSGKSSVLEAISGVPFPRNDTLCTRFATEVILREAATTEVTVSIVPSQNASESERQKLSSFVETLSGLEDLPALIDRAKLVMGITTTGNAFSKDILRVEVSGPKKPKLTVVDLPGLIHSGSKQQSEDDVALISELVQNYMENPRSIILAVVSAKNDYANQIILKRAREVDLRGLRTLGLITKPDTLPPGSDSEAEFIDLASNNNIEFRLGWHILKNRDYNKRDCSSEERDREEAAFFSRGAWTCLPQSMVGIATLRRRLSKILLDQIKQYLPSLTRDISSSIADSERKLAMLGDSRGSLDEQRRFLLKLSQTFQKLCKAAVDGEYEDPFFGNPMTSESEYRKRLRALVQNKNMDFAEAMRRSGHRRVISTTNRQPHTQYSHQIAMSRPEAIEWVRCILIRSRGRELPGSFNPLLVNELFQDQSSQWEKFARLHVETIWKESEKFLEKVLSSLTDDETFQSVFNHFIDHRTRESLKRANESLDRLLMDKGRQPITYNHYYTDTLHDLRWNREYERLVERLEAARNHSGYWHHNLTDLAKSLMPAKESNMDNYACLELLDSMQAYYKVSLMIRFSETKSSFYWLRTNWDSRWHLKPSSTMSPCR